MTAWKSYSWRAAKKLVCPEWIPTCKEQYALWNQRATDGCRLLLQIDVEMDDLLSAIGVHLSPDEQRRKVKAREALRAILQSTKALSAAQVRNSYSRTGTQTERIHWL